MESPLLRINWDAWRAQRGEMLRVQKDWLYGGRVAATVSTAGAATLAMMGENEAFEGVVEAWELGPFSDERTLRFFPETFARAAPLAGLSEVEGCTLVPAVESRWIRR